MTTSQLIATAPRRADPPLLLWIPALDSWESACWFEGAWRMWANLDVTLSPSHWREPPRAPAGALDEFKPLFGDSWPPT